MWTWGLGGRGEGETRRQHDHKACLEACFFKVQGLPMPLVKEQLGLASHLKSMMDLSY